MDAIKVFAKEIQIAELLNDEPNLFSIPNDNSGMLFRELEKVKKLTSNNPRQQLRIDSLSNYLEHYIQCCLKPGIGISINLSDSNKKLWHGSLSSTAISKLILSIQNEERALLIERKNDNEHSLSVIKQFCMYLFIFLNLFIGMLLVLFLKYLRKVQNKHLRQEELIIINEQLAELNLEKENRALELIIANHELAFQNTEKENRASELIIANKELAFQNTEKENRASELIIANDELAFQNREKENRAFEFIIANKELEFQNTEKENRAAELTIANTELAFQNTEKENRAAELTIANTELAFQNTEKENRAKELILAVEELAFQNSEKEKRAIELIMANDNLKIAEGQQQQHINGLEEMMFMTSHRVRQPVMNILGLSALLRDSTSITEQEQLVDGLEKSAFILDTFTRELTVLLGSLQKIGK